MKYVEGFVVPVPKKKLDEYKKLARKFGKICKDHGAVDYVECVADDVKKGKVTSFPQAVKLKRNETVVFSWVSFKTRNHREDGHQRHGAQVFHRHGFVDQPEDRAETQPGHEDLRVRRKRHSDRPDRAPDDPDGVLQARRERGCDERIAGQTTGDRDRVRHRPGPH